MFDLLHAICQTPAGWAPRIRSRIHRPGAIPRGPLHDEFKGETDVFQRVSADGDPYRNDGFGPDRFGVRPDSRVRRIRRPTFLRRGRQSFPPTGVTQLIYSATHDALILKNSESAIAVIKLGAQSSTLHFSEFNFTDMSISPSGRYVFAADYGGENIGSGTPWQTSYVHRLDLEDGSWEAKTAYIAGNVQAIANDQVVLKSIDQWVTFTNNLWGEGTALVPVNAASDGWGPAYYAGVYAGDFRYVESAARLLHGNSGLSSQELQAFRVSDNDFVQQEGSGIYGSAQGYGGSVALAVDESAAYYGALQVDPLDVGHNLRVFPEVIVAATGDIAFGEDSYYDAHTGAVLGHLGFTSDAYGLNSAGSDFWVFDTSHNLLRHFVRNDRIFADGLEDAAESRTAGGYSE